MPVYEFRCKSCHRKCSFFSKSMSEALSPSCPSCGSKDLVRLISSVAFQKSLDAGWEGSGDPGLSSSNPDYYKDPRNIGRWAEKRFQEMGVEMPSQLQQEIQAAREGELPGQLKDLKPGPGQV